jgi:hypothetical protein
MKSNVLSFHMDYWYTNSIIDCGEEVFNVIIDEKLNKNCYEKNNNNIKNESTTFNNRNKKINNQYNQSNIERKSNDYRSTKYKDSTIRVNHIEKANKHSSIYQGTNTDYNKRKVQQVPPTSRLQEFKQDGRKVLLDTFPKPRIKNIKI